MKNNFNVIACAFSLIAVSYGLARFAFGLLLPQIREELLLDISTAGWIGSGAFLAYCVGIVSTFHFSKVCSPRTMAFTAGLCATIGMAAVAYAASGWALGFGIALAGLSTGLASPPLASAVSLRFANEFRPKANTIINSGTAVGIIFSGLASPDGLWQLAANLRSFCDFQCLGDILGLAFYAHAAGAALH